MRTTPVLACVLLFAQAGAGRASDSHGLAKRQATRVDIQRVPTRLTWTGV